MDRRLTPRGRLVGRLDALVDAARMVVVAAEAGAGKTSLVADWASRLGNGADVRWHDLRGGHLRADTDGRRSALHRTESAGLRRIVVLDNFPVVPDDSTHLALDTLVHRGGRDLGLVLICPVPPRLDLQQLGTASDCRTIGSAELALNSTEIAAALSREGVEPSPHLITEIERRTGGWAWGVRRLAALLNRSGSSTRAFREADLLIAEYLENSTLRRLSPSDRDLITRTSVVDEVTPDIAAALVGAGRRLTGAVAEQSRGFVRPRADGSFTIHRTLRRHLLDELRGEPTVVRDNARRAAQIALGHGDVDTAVEVAVEAADWDWAATTAVESLWIPRLMTAVEVDPLFDRPGVADALASAQPLLGAAVALGRSWPDVARVELQRLDSADPGAQSDSPVTELSTSLLRMALARWEADSEAGLSHHRAAAAKLARLTISERAAAPELVPMLQAHLATFELAVGSTERARVALERGARVFRARPAADVHPAAQLIAADCMGKLAWVEALSGELTSALRHAAEVLTARPADSHELGVVHAQLATIWCHLSRAEFEQAIQRHEGVVNRDITAPDGAVQPELAVATGLTSARLAALAGHGRIGHEVRQLCQSTSYAPQFEHQLRLIRAEAELDCGEPTAALRLLGGSTQGTAEVHILRARAWIQLGDLASVAASLRVRPVEPLPTISKIQIELIEGWLARAHGDRDHQRCLIDRALQAAGREGLRAPIAWAKPWLHDVIAADPALLRRHGTFLASVRNVGLDDPGNSSRPTSTPGPAPALTGREIDILQRLGALSTNEEIAADLFLSANTVKTHLKSLYRKLEVTRRSDAFRRGRALGLC